MAAEYEHCIAALNGVGIEYIDHYEHILRAFLPEEWFIVDAPINDFPIPFRSRRFRQAYPNRLLRNEKQILIGVTGVVWNRLNLKVLEKA